MRGPLSVLRVADGAPAHDRPAECLEAVGDGIDIERVETAAAALDSLDPSTHDCVLADEDLPDADGVELLADVRAEYPDIPVVLSTEDGATPGERALEAGVTDYVSADADETDYRLLANRIERISRARAADARGASGTDERSDVDRSDDDLVASLPDGVVAIDETETVRRANEAVAERLETTVDELEGRTLPGLVETGHVSEEFVTSYREAAEALRAGETETARVETSVVRDGTRYTYEARFAARPGDGFRGSVGTVRDVTHRAARETELERYEALLKTIPDTVVMTDTDGYHLEVHGFEGWSGYTREELIGEHISITTPEEYVEQAEEVAAELFLDEDREKATFEMEIETKDGELLPFENHLTLLPPDEDGEIPGTMSVLREITDRKERERELEIYETAVESTTDGIAVMNPETEFLLVNSRFAESVGRPKEEIEGITVGEASEADAIVDAPDDLTERWIRTGEEARETGRSSFSYESTVDVEQGRIVIENTVTGVRRDDGEVIYVVISRDITERKERQEEIERLHESTRELMAAESEEAAARQVVSAVETTLGFPANVVRLVNDAGDQLEPVAVTDRARDLLGDRPAVSVDDTALGRAFRTGEPLLLDDVREHTDAYDDADVRTLLSLPIGDYGLLSIVDDEIGAYDESDVQIAEIMAANAEAAFDRIEKEAALRERERALSRQIDRLDQFASIVSHDLRNPLNVAKGHLSFVEEQVEDTDDVETVDGALDRMGAIIDDVLTLARKGDEATDLAPVSLRETAEGCWSNVDTAAATLTVESERTIRADESRLQQLLENLFRNAIEHVGEDVRLRVGGLDDGFYVEDDGPGIPETERDDVFEAGFSTSSHGTGFGLNIVETIAEAHEWDVRVTDGTDGGARFEVTGVEFADA